MDEHGLREHEAADEQEDDGIGKRRERVARRDDAEDNRQDRADQGRDRKRERFRDPEDHHHCQDGGETMGGSWNRQRRKQEPDERKRAEYESNRPAPSVELLLGG